MARIITLTELLRATDPENLITLKEVESDVITVVQLLQSLLKHADGSLLLKSMGQRPWLRDFYDSNDFEKSLSAFREDVNETTIVLIEHLDMCASTILAEIWGFSKPLKSLKEDADLKKQVDAKEDTTKMADAFITSLPELKKHPTWHHVCERVRKFCLLAGSAKTFPNPFSNIDALRDISLRTPSTSNEARLSAEIEQLRMQIKEYEKRNNSQGRIIANLSYRYLLERLPGPAPNHVSNTAYWQTFWTLALQNASRSTTHPLATLLQRFGNDKRMLTQIQKVGEGLYGTLSTNIHHFQGVYDVEPCQWDELPGAILQALSPINFHANGSVDWIKERARYV